MAPVPCAVPAALDCGNTGRERRLYLRELVARFGYELALSAVTLIVSDTINCEPESSSRNLAGKSKMWLSVIRR